MQTLQWRNARNGSRFGPTPIDGEAIESFVERWLARLALAHGHKLGPS